jgi:hypothetical protein
MAKLTKAEKREKKLDKKLEKTNGKYLEAKADAESLWNQLYSCQKEHEKHKAKIEDSLYLPMSESSPHRKWVLVKRLAKLNTVSNISFLFVFLHFYVLIDIIPRYAIPFHFVSGAHCQRKGPRKTCQEGRQIGSEDQDRVHGGHPGQE